MPIKFTLILQPGWASIMRLNNALVIGHIYPIFPAMSHLAVLYNAQCPLCSAEIGHYAAYSARNGLNIEFQDLNTVDLGLWSLTKEQAGRRLHVRQGDEMRSGIDAFLILWRAMPRYAWIARVVSLPGLKTLADLGYNHVLAPAIYNRYVRRQARAASK